MIVDELNRTLLELKSKAQAFTLLLNSIEGNFDQKTSEIKALEIKRDALRKEVEETQAKASSIMEAGMEKSDRVRKEANELMEAANIQSITAKRERDEAVKMKFEAQALMDQARDKQKDADKLWHQLNEQKNRIKQAAGL